jgi:hypothetical protein
MARERNALDSRLPATRLLRQRQSTQHAGALAEEGRRDEGGANVGGPP